MNIEREIKDGWQKLWSLRVAALATFIASASSIVAQLQGVVPSWAYVLLVVVAAVLPGVTQVKQ